MEPRAFTLRHMSVGAVARVRLVVVVVVLCLLAACSAGAPNESASPSTAASDAAQDKSGGSSEGSTGQGRESGLNVPELQGDAASAAEQIESGGLRVRNQTGEPVNLVFADGSTARVGRGNTLTLVPPCGNRLPLRVETLTGEVIAKRGGSCRLRLTWTVR